MTYEPSEETIEKIREAREDLEDLAETDLNAAKYAKELLAVLEEHDQKRP